MELFLQFVCVVGLLLTLIFGIGWKVVKVWESWINSPVKTVDVELTEEEIYFGVEHYFGN